MYQVLGTCKRLRQKRGFPSTLDRLKHGVCCVSFLLLVFAREIVIRLALRACDTRPSPLKRFRPQRQASLSLPRPPLSVGRCCIIPIKHRPLTRYVPVSNEIGAASVEFQKYFTAAVPFIIHKPSLLLSGPVRQRITCPSSLKQRPELHYYEGT